ncbi:MAG: hypothetical protein RIS64_2174 [Bacteroidota bacterium]|jgi:uncharacterized membrane protein
MNSTNTVADVNATVVPPKESHARSLAKGVSWRIIGTLDTMIWAWFFTGNLVMAAKIGAFEIGSKVILYYFHERIWQSIPFGFRERWLKRFKPAAKIA